MLTSHVVGDYRPSDAQCEYLALSFSTSSAPLRSRWRNNGVSADFLGDYVMTFFPSEAGIAGAGGDQAEIKHAVTYIANEFLENAMKYHERDVNVPIGIRLELKSDGIVVSASNGISLDQAARYKSFIEYIFMQDAGDLLHRQLEAGSAGPASEGSALGLLTMISDYGAKLSWQFETDPAKSQSMTVTTSAVLPLTSLSGGPA